MSDSRYWSDALLAAKLVAVDPVGLGGVALRAGAGPARENWLARMRALVPPATPWRRIPLGIDDARLLGGLDLAATLSSGRPVAARGVLAEADGGVVLLPMAERIAPGTAARIAAALDRGEVVVERDGFAMTLPARLTVVALDEGAGDDERLCAPLADRLAFHVDLAAVALRDTYDDGEDGGVDFPAIAAARERVSGVRVADALVESLCGAALALGVFSLRAPLLAVRAARAAAALAGRTEADLDDAALAARLVLVPRATQVPATDEDEDKDHADAPPPETPPPDSADTDNPAELDANDDLVLAAAHAVLPPHLLALARDAARRRARVSNAGRAGQAQRSSQRGRPIGVTRGAPRRGARLDVVETLRAAAPWQRLRARGDGARVAVRPDDFRIVRRKHRATTTTVFVVDASGSSAANRLAEAKGAVELLLAECYVRRDRVALISFRGTGSEVLLPPTRSLARAKRSLAGLPGGGGTPLALGLDAARALAEALVRRGETPTLVILTDGRANVARDGTPSRDRAADEARGAARALRIAGISVILIDTSPQPQAQARELAAAMDARYLPLPHADAATLTRALQRLT